MKMVTRDRIIEVQMNLQKINHAKVNPVMIIATHEEIEELIYILGNLIYFMTMTHKEDI